MTVSFRAARAAFLGVALAATVGFSTAAGVFVPGGSPDAPPGRPGGTEIGSSNVTLTNSKTKLSLTGIARRLFTDLKTKRRITVPWFAIAKEAARHAPTLFDKLQLGVLKHEMADATRNRLQETPLFFTVNFIISSDRKDKAPLTVTVHYGIVVTKGEVYAVPLTAEEVWKTDPSSGDEVFQGWEWVADETTGQGYSQDFFLGTVGNMTPEQDPWDADFED